jgi:hypothetical protein
MEIEPVEITVDLTIEDVEEHIERMATDTQLSGQTWRQAHPCRGDSRRYSAGELRAEERAVCGSLERGRGNGGGKALLDKFS